MGPNPVLTVGHSTHALEDFLNLLAAHAVTHVVDVRIWPRSRRYPHFHGDALAVSLSEAGIQYTHLPGLGGRRRPSPDSANTGWKNEGFRGYADYMQTPAFGESLARLIALAEASRVAVMCAEAVPWRCHRTLISDALLARGIPVEHILSPTKRQPHQMTPFAVVEGDQVRYP